MQPNDRTRLLKYLQDSLDACLELQMNTANTVAKEYEQSSIKWIVERDIEIISEALKRASVIENNLPITGLNKIFATRNKLPKSMTLLTLTCFTQSFKKAYLY